MRESVRSRREALAKIYAGSGIPGLAEQLGVSVATIYNDLKALKLLPEHLQKTRTVLTQDQRDELAARYEAGEPAVRLRTRFGVCQATIAKEVRSRGLKRPCKRSDGRYDPRSGEYRCSRCRRWLPEDHFINCPAARTRDELGKRYRCRDCESETAEEYRQTQEHRKWHRDYERVRRVTHKEQMLLSNASRRARRKGVPFDLKLDDIDIPELCPVFGLPLRRDNSDRMDDSPTLDRIVPELGYVKGNVRVISWRANRIKSDATLEELQAVVIYVKQATS